MDGQGKTKTRRKPIKVRCRPAIFTVLALEETPVGVAIFEGPQFVITFANPLVCQMWGRTHEQVIHKPLFEALPEASKQGFEELLRGVLATGVPYVGHDLPVTLYRNGKLDTVYFNFVYSPVRDANGQVTAVMVIASEVTGQIEANPKIGESEKWQSFLLKLNDVLTPGSWTDFEGKLASEIAERTWETMERAKAEEALRKSEKRLQLATDAAKMGTFIYYPDEDRGDPDTQMLALYGLPPDDTLNLARALAEIIHPDESMRYAHDVAQALNPAGNGKLNLDIRIIHPDGSVHWMNVTAQTQFEGNPPQAVSIRAFLWISPSANAQRKHSKKHSNTKTNLSTLPAMS